jgi:chitodextrinase
MTERTEVRFCNNYIVQSLAKCIAVSTSLFLFAQFTSMDALAQSNQTSPLGTNLAQVTYWTVEQPFLNIFKVAGGWTTRNSNGNTATGEEALLYSSFLDSNGYPTTLTAGPAHSFNEVSALIYQGPGINYPSGQYLFLYDGTGTFNFSFDASVASSSPGKIVLNVNATVSGIFAILTSTDPNRTGDNARNFRLVYCGSWNGSSCSSGYDTLLANGEMFNPNFIALIKPFKTMRFMWWQNTIYDSTTTSWATRATPGWAFWDDQIKFGGSVPAEVLFALCNELGADGWFNMPFLASDDYVTQFAKLAHTSLNSNLKAYVEYGNEVWNPAMPSGVFARMAALGQALFPTANTQPATQVPFPYAFDYGIYSAVHMGAIWKTVWGADANRVVRVAAGQTGYSGRNQYILDFVGTQDGGSASYFSGTAGANVDAFATAPYFGYAVPDTFTLDQLFTEINSGGLVSGGYPGGMIKQILDYTTADYGVASAAGLPLIAYEGGQTLIDPTHSDTTLQNLYAAANRDPRMGTAYTTFFNGWRSLGGQLFVNFTDIGPYSQWGYWGAVEYLSEGSTAKYAALTGFINSNPCWWSGCTPSVGIKVQPGGTPPTSIVAPSAPARLSDSPVSASQVNLAWSASTDSVSSVAGYNVFRNGIKVGTTTTTSYQDNSLSPAMTYTYAVSAYDTAGNISPLSSPLSVTTPAPPNVAISSPTNGVLIKGNEGISIVSSASDATAIKSITIMGDNQILHTCASTASCSVTWQGKSISRGTHVIQAIATDQFGLTTSKSITILALK